MPRKRVEDDGKALTRRLPKFMAIGKETTRASACGCRGRPVGIKTKKSRWHFGRLLIAACLCDSRCLTRASNQGMTYVEGHANADHASCVCVCAARITSGLLRCDAVSAPCTCRFLHVSVPEIAMPAAARNENHIGVPEKGGGRSWRFRRVLGSQKMGSSGEACVASCVCCFSLCILESCSASIRAH